MLDFAKIIPQINLFTQDRAQAVPLLEAALTEAGRRLRESGATWEETLARLLNPKTSWLVARWLEPPDVRHPLPPCPPASLVLAADGSQVVSDRHDVALFYLLNVGLIALHYGPDAHATLTSRPVLSPPDDDLLDNQEGEQEAIARTRLSIRRFLVEIEGLTELIVANAPAPPSLALVDGSLILWQIGNEENEFRFRSLQAFHTHLETARQNRTPVAGYISQSQSRDVIHSLRIAVCPYPEVNCDRNCPNRARPKPLFQAPDCAGTESITDTELFTRILQPGQRSAVFGSQAPIVREYPEAHQIRFFYLHTGFEVARVEIPAWVADDPTLLEQTHTLCYDQAQKGLGYPVALAEAHEQAIIRGAERDALLLLLERASVAQGLAVTTTRKALSKRARRV